MAREDLRKDLKELRDQVEALRGALADVARPYSELVDYLERLQGAARGYFRLLDLYTRYGSVSPDVVVPGLKDDISRHIVSALFEKDDRNISQITDSVKGRRGTASRRIVRERLQELEDRGVVVASAGPHGRTYRISDETARRWTEVLLPAAESRRTDSPAPAASREGQSKP